MKTLWFFPLLALLACADPLDFERHAPERQSFGTEVYGILYKDLERAPVNGPDKATALQQHREDLIAAIDTTLPPDALSPWNDLLRRSLPYFEDQSIPDLVRMFSTVLEDLAEDQDFLNALVAWDREPDLWIDPNASLSTINYLLADPKIEELQAFAILMVHELDGRKDNDLLAALFKQLEKKFRTAEFDPQISRLIPLLVDLLLTEDPAFAPQDQSHPIYAVKLDARGLPKVALNDLGMIPQPFADKNGDGLADVDEQGNFVDEQDHVIHLPPFGPPNEDLSPWHRDEWGRLRNGDRPVYEEIDLQSTVLAYLLRESKPMIEADILFDLKDGLRPILGDVQSLEDDSGRIQYFNPKGPGVALIRSLLLVLDYEDLPALIQGALILIQQYPDLLAQTIHALDQAMDLLDQYPNQISDTINLLDELLPILLKIAQTPGLTEATLQALRDPLIRDMGPIAVQLMNHYADFIEVPKDSPYDTCAVQCDQDFALGTAEHLHCIQGCPNEIIFQNLMDQARMHPSLFERMLGIIWESSGVPYDVAILQLRTGTFDMIEVAQEIGDAMNIEDMAVAYLRSVTGDLPLEEIINPKMMDLAEPFGMDATNVTDVMIWIAGNLLDLTLDPYPTPGQLTRFFNKRPLSKEDESFAIELSMPVCKSQRLCIDANADALFAVEASGMVDVLYPFAKAFNEHHKTALLAQALAIVYKHYPSEQTRALGPDQQPIAVTTDNLRSIEPALIEILNADQLLPTTLTLVEQLMQIYLSDQSYWYQHFEDYLVFLLEPDQAWTLIDGSHVILDPAGNEIQDLSPAYLVIDAIRTINDLLDQNPKAKDAWTRVLDQVFDLLFEVKEDQNGQVHFAKPANIALTQIALRRFKQEWENLEALALRHQTLSQDWIEDVEGWISDPLWPILFDLLDWIQVQDQGPSLLKHTALYLLDRQDILEKAIHTALHLYLYQRQWIPLVHTLAKIIDWDREWENCQKYSKLNLIQHAIDVLDQFDQLDQENLIWPLVHRALGDHPSWDKEDLPIEIIWQSIRDVHRVDPLNPNALSTEDWASIFREVADYLKDPQRGAERLNDLIHYALTSTGEVQ